MNKKIMLVLIIGSFLLSRHLRAQSHNINRITLSKEMNTFDSIATYNLTATIELMDSLPLQGVQCRIKGVSSDTAYFERTFTIPLTEGTFVNGIMKDQLSLFINLGTFILKEPVLLETELIDTNNNHSTIYQTNE